eukprot:scaffold72287_cov63-Phaeocystis_antarctica.AAC.1
MWKLACTCSSRQCAATSTARWARLLPPSPRSACRHASHHEHLEPPCARRRRPGVAPLRRPSVVAFPKKRTRAASSPPSAATSHVAASWPPGASEALPTAHASAVTQSGARASKRSVALLRAAHPSAASISQPSGPAAPAAPPPPPMSRPAVPLRSAAWKRYRDASQPSPLSANGIHVASGGGASGPRCSGAAQPMPTACGSRLLGSHGSNAHGTPCAGTRGSCSRRPAATATSSSSATVASNSAGRARIASLHAAGGSRTVRAPPASDAAQRGCNASSTRPRSGLAPSPARCIPYAAPGDAPLLARQLAASAAGGSHPRRACRSSWWPQSCRKESGSCAYCATAASPYRPASRAASASTAAGRRVGAR